MEILLVSRWIHILAGLAWVGEVLTINFVIVPALKTMPEKNRAEFVSSVFPRVFRLATVLALTSALAGVLSSYLITGWEKILERLLTPWGIGIYGGGLLAFILILFHLVLERRIKPLVATGEESVGQIVYLLGIIPRIGLAVIILITVLMFYGASMG